MRMAWVTPLARGTGVSKYSLSALSMLRQRADVEVWAPCTADDYPYPVPPVRKLRNNDATALALRGYDLVVFNMGNNPAYHAEIQRLSERVPGVVVVHDKRMHGFYFDLWAVTADDPTRYAAMMRYYYGASGERAAADVLASRAGVDSWEEFPLVEPALWNAEGIVVHSRNAVESVSRYGDLVPVAILEHPFDRQSILGSTDLPTRTELVPTDDRVLIVSSGGIFEQKRIDKVIRALASSALLRAHARLAIVGGGRPEYIARLRSLAAELDVTEIVSFTGRVDDRAMYGWLSAADVAVNLRFPSTESASFSLVEQLAFGDPVIVSATSHYADLPDGVALKVPVDAREPAALTAALEALVGDSSVRAVMSREAAGFAADTYSLGRYAEGFMALAERVLASREPPRD